MPQFYVPQIAFRNQPPILVLVHRKSVRQTPVGALAVKDNRNGLSSPSAAQGLCNSILILLIQMMIMIGHYGILLAILVAAPPKEMPWPATGVDAKVLPV